VQEDEVSNLDKEEDDNDKALLQSQLLDNDPPPPSINFAHELGRHLSEFQGYGQTCHSHRDAANQHSQES
jgi:hypothetical protein